MRYGISAAALVIQNRQVLLVNHKAAGQYDFWLPPGGRVEGEESIFECARRETFEETGLAVQPDRILYIQEFTEPDYHFCKFFIVLDLQRRADARSSRAGGDFRGCSLLCPATCRS
jgi:ADP-ribose pyrophosphatase YjhB (NUDIX family)